MEEDKVKDAAASERPGENGPEKPETPETTAQTETTESGDTQQPDTPASSEQPEPAEQAEPAEPAETAEPPADDAEEPAPLTPEEEAAEAERRAEITRTVQVSIEQIMEASDGQNPADGADASDAEESEPEESVLQVVAHHLLRWLALVAVLVLVIAVGGVVWLYRKATPDMIPTVTVTLDGQTLEATSYRWKVPVIGNFFKRTYAETLSAKPRELTEEIEDRSPDLSISSTDFASEITVVDADGEEVFSGTALDFNVFRFAESGSYSAKLVLSTSGGYRGEPSVTGHQTYEFNFTVNILPVVRLNTNSVSQGGVAAIRVSGLAEDEKPRLVSKLSCTGFYESEDGWVAYLPVGLDTDAGDYDLTVETGTTSQTVTLTVRDRTPSYRDYTSRSSLVTPYVGAEDTPQQVLDLLETAEPTIYWAASGFTSPFSKSVNITLAYGTTEYVNRTRQERLNGTGTGRTSCNAVLTGRCDLVAPADGKVLLAQQLKGVGNTLVIEHGAGVKTIFYGLKSLSVKEGTKVTQGQVIAATANATVVEVRIGKTAVEPLAILRGQCDALKNY